MGKSGKKSATKVEAKPVSAVPVKSLKGKRDAKDDIEKQLNAKKQKKDATVEQVIQEEKAEETNGSDSPDSEEEQQEPAVPVKKAVAAKNGKVEEAKAASEESEEDEESEESEEDEESNDDEQPTNKTDADGSSEESEEEEESEDEKVTPNKKPNTPVAQAQAQAQERSKTLFVGNLSFKVQRSDIEQFFQDAGEVVDVRVASSEDGRSKGFGHVEFVSAEAAQKALKLNGHDLLGREVKLDMARERGAQTPQSGKTNNSSQNGGRGQSQTIFVKGFDSSVGEDEIKNSLREHFGSCGDITRISVPTDRDTGDVKGIAYLDMSDSEAFSKALELNGSDMGGDSLTVDEAKPRDSSGFGGRSGGRGGGRNSGGRFGGRGRGRGGGRRGRGSR